MQKGEVWTDERRRDDAALITDSPDLEDRDFLFSEDHLQEAIRYYYEMRASGKLIINDDMKRFDASGHIEVDSITESGRKFRLSAGIQNSHMAALATVYYANLSKNAEQAIQFGNELSDLLMSGNAISI